MVKYAMKTTVTAINNRDILLKGKAFKIVIRTYLIKLVPTELAICNTQNFLTTLNKYL